MQRARAWGRISLSVGDFRRVYLAGEVSVSLGQAEGTPANSHTPTVCCVQVGGLHGGARSDLTSPLETRGIDAIVCDEDDKNSSSFKYSPL